MKKKKITVYIIIIALIIIVGAFLWIKFSHKKSDYKVTFNTTTITKGSLSSTVTATGTVNPIKQVEVGTQVSGIVNKIYVDYNSVVKKNQVIAELDKTNLQNELSAKKSSCETALNEFEYQKKNFQRVKALHDKQLASDADYDEANYSYQTAKNNYEISKLNLANAQTNLGYATIYSPIDGVVLSKSVEEGQTVASSFSTPTLFIIAQDLTQMQVIANVDEADIGDVAVGQRVTFTVDAYPDVQFEGKVTQVRLEATTSNNVVTYEVVIDAPNPELKLKPGLTANIVIYTIDLQDVLEVSSKALKFTPKEPYVTSTDKVVDCQGKNKLWKHEGNTFTAIPVEIGITSSGMTQILSGIDEGTVVVSDAVIGTTSNNGSEQTIQQGKETTDNKAESSNEKSPFMPSRPGSKNKSK